MIKDILNTYREAFRQWVRSKTRPKTIIEAEEKRLFWSKCYLFSVTCAVGIFLLQLYRESVTPGDKTLPFALRLAKGMKDNESLRIIKYSGLTRVSDETVSAKDLKMRNTLKEGGTSAPEET